MTETDKTLRIATQLVTTTAFGSPSMISRVLRQKHDIEIGFRDACALLDQMEAAGIVGPQYGSHARDVLMSPDEAQAALDRHKDPASIRAAALREAADIAEMVGSGYFDNSHSGEGNGAMAVAAELRQRADVIHPA